MKVLVDTAIWSLALRRGSRGQGAHVAELASLIQDGRVVMVGAVRQEILSGIREHLHFTRLREHLRAFPDVVVTSDDHEQAASLFNRCRAKGIQGSNTDFLICAIAARHKFSIYSTDSDFMHFAKVLPIVLHEAGR